jgi:hypothetical protein
MANQSKPRVIQVNHGWSAAGGVARGWYVFAPQAGEIILTVANAELDLLPCFGTLPGSV